MKKRKSTPLSDPREMAAKRSRLVQRVLLAALTSNTRLLASSQWFRVRCIYAVNSHHSRLQSERELDAARGVLRENRHHQSVQRVVHPTEYALLVLELDDHTNWPENLLPNDACVWLRVCEDHLLDLISFLPMSLASKVHLCTLFFASFDVAHAAL